MNREKIGTRLGFIMLSAACAIGCGNVWKFPWMTGQNGGGAFVLVYAICLLVLGLPVMTMEFAMGRASQASPVRMYHKLTPEKKIWRIHGYVALFGNFCLMAFYTTVTGWMFYYAWCFLTGHTAELNFGAMVSNPYICAGFMLVAVALGFVVLSFNLQSGLERVNKYMMSALFLILIVLAVKAATLPGAMEGYRFYLVPDFSLINGKIIAAAMNQAFFTLSCGIGSMAIFGSYIDKDHSLLGESVNVIILDTFVAIMAGMIIFPACASYELEVGSGPALLFNTMATVFNHMPGGRIWGSAFFLFMMFAAFSTLLAVCENILACVREITGWDRKKGSVVCGILVAGTSLTTALGFSVLPFHPFGPDSVFLDFWDFIVSANLLPLGAMVFTLYCVTNLGWGWDNFMAEANTGKGLKIRPWMRWIYSIVLPIGIVVVYILGLRG